MLWKALLRDNLLFVIFEPERLNHEKRKELTLLCISENVAFSSFFLPTQTPFFFLRPFSFLFLSFCFFLYLPFKRIMMDLRAPLQANLLLLHIASFLSKNVSWNSDGICSLVCRRNKILLKKLVIFCVFGGVFVTPKLQEVRLQASNYRFIFLDTKSFILKPTQDLRRNNSILIETLFCIQLILISIQASKNCLWSSFLKSYRCYQVPW